MMTPREVFDAAYLRVCRAQNMLPDVEHAEECWRAVQRHPASLYDDAASRLNATCRFLPKPAEWIEACQDAADAASRAARDDDDRAWAQEAERPRTYACPTCQDTGFEPQFCQPGQLCSSCRRGPHLYDHPYRTRCACSQTNPVIERRRRAQRETTQAPKRGRAD